MLKKYTILATIAMVSASLQLSASTPVLSIEVDGSDTATYGGNLSGGGYVNKTGTGTLILSLDNSTGTPLLGAQISGGTLSISDVKNIGGSSASVEFLAENSTLDITNSTSDMTIALVKKSAPGSLNVGVHTLTITAFDTGTGEIDVNGNGLGTLICPLTDGSYSIGGGATLKPASTNCINTSSSLNIMGGTLDCSNLTGNITKLPAILTFYHNSTLKLVGGSAFTQSIIVHQ
jgi:fibronectin-binding autotransporter adhesin